MGNIGECQYPQQWYNLCKHIELITFHLVIISNIWGNSHMLPIIWLHIKQFSLLVSIIKIKVVIRKSVDNISMANDNFYNCDRKNGLYCSVLFFTAYYIVKIMIISARTFFHSSNPILREIGEVLEIKSSLWNLFTNFASRNTK